MLRTALQSSAVLALCCTLGATAGTAKPAFTIFGETMTVEVSGADTNGASTTIRIIVPPGGSPPAAHVHSREDETFYIVRGHFRFWEAKKTIGAVPGSVIFLPRNVPHQFMNVGTTTGEQVLTVVPAGLDKFFEEVARRKLTLPKDGAAIVKLSADYGIKYVAPLGKAPAGT